MNWVRGLQTEGLGRKSMCWETNPTSVCFQVCLWVWVSCGESPLGSTFSPLLSLYHSLASQLKIVTFKFRPVRLKYIKTGIKMFPELVLPSSYYCQCSLKSAGVHCCTPTAQLHKSTRLWIKKKKLALPQVIGEEVWRTSQEPDSERVGLKISIWKKSTF